MWMMLAFRHHSPLPFILSEKEYVFSLITGNNTKGVEECRCYTSCMKKGSRENVLDYRPAWQTMLCLSSIFLYVTVLSSMPSYLTYILYVLCRSTQHETLIFPLFNIIWLIYTLLDILLASIFFACFVDCHSCIFHYISHSLDCTLPCLTPWFLTFFTILISSQNFNKSVSIFFHFSVIQFLHTFVLLPYIRVSCPVKPITPVALYSSLHNFLYYISSLSAIQHYFWCPCNHSSTLKNIAKIFETLNPC